MFYTRFNRPPNPPTKIEGPSLTLQSAKDECDIHFIMARYEKTGQYYPNVSTSREPMFGDASQLPDYQESLNFIISAQEQFESLPAKLRKRFNHDPNQLLEFVSNSGNKQEAIALGLIPETGISNPAQLTSP